MFMSVGSAAGVAAKQLVDGEVSTVQDVDVTKVQCSHAHARTSPQTSPSSLFCQYPTKTSHPEHHLPPTTYHSFCRTMLQVQAILNTTFRQRLHGPPGQNPSPPSPPTAAYYIVSGAGSEEWNGQYLKVTGAGGYGGYIKTECKASVR
jgi:hypothetical protein